MKIELHPNNAHRGLYDFKNLVKACPKLGQFVADHTINFANPIAVKILNQAILKYHYGIEWDLPAPFLCPPIPGRADYIHYLADLNGNTGLRVLDIGVGANCIYPLLGQREYGWSFVGTDIDPKALTIAGQMLKRNRLEEWVELRLQSSPHQIFRGVVGDGEPFDFSMCNPPFHRSFEEARAGTARKWKNLKVTTKALNFGGQSNELWCSGGEVAFITRMVEESVDVNCKIFTTLVSKSSNLPPIYDALKKVKASVKTISMGQGQKKSRIVAWRF